MSRATLRTAAKAHWCMGCDRRIGAGERYWRWVSFPSDQVFDHITAGAECSSCAARYGRPVDGATT